MRSKYPKKIVPPSLKKRGPGRPPNAVRTVDYRRQVLPEQVKPLDTLLNNLRAVGQAAQSGLIDER